MRASILATASALAILAGGSLTANAQPGPTVFCTRDTTIAGGGAFNFTCKETGAQNYCIPYLPLNSLVPRGGEGAIDAWVRGVQLNPSFSFTDDGAVSQSVCALPGSHQASGTSTN